jgi:hypothetical protein
VMRPIARTQNRRRPTRSRARIAHAPSSARTQSRTLPRVRTLPLINQIHHPGPARQRTGPLRTHISKPRSHTCAKAVFANTHIRSPSAFTHAHFETTQSHLRNRPGCEINRTHHPGPARDREEWVQRARHGGGQDRHGGGQDRLGTVAVKTGSTGSGSRRAR